MRFREMGSKDLPRQKSGFADIEAARYTEIAYHEEFESNQLRKDYRIKLPARARINGGEYKVLNWSFAGFAVGDFLNGDPEKNADNNGNHAPVEFVLPFSSYNVTFNAYAELRWSKNGQAGFGFTHIDTKTRIVIKEYVNAYVEGRLDSCGDVIGKPKEKTVVPLYEIPLTSQERGKFKGKFRRHLGLYTLLAVLVVLLSIFLVYEHRYVFSTTASVRGNLVEIGSPVAGTIKNISVSEGDKISNGHLLLEIDSTELRNEVEAARSLLEQRKEVYRKTLGVIGEEQKRLQLYLIAAQQKEKMVKNQLDGVRADLAQARIEFERAKVLFAHNAINRADMEGKENACLQLDAKYREVEEELRLARQVIEDAREGRFFSFAGTGIQGRAKELEQDLATQGALIKQTEVLLQTAEDKMKKASIVSICDGIVNTNVRLKGDYINVGDLVMTIETPSHPWIVARYKPDDAQLIRPGDKAEIYFPSLNLHVEGRVQAVGHDSLTSRGLTSMAMETSQLEIPVKILFNQVPHNIRTGIRAEVRIKTRLYFAIIPKFFWSSIGNSKTAAL